MHNTIAELKSGEVISGPIWTWMPRLGWFTLIVGDDEIRISFDDCEGVVTKGSRDRVNASGVPQLGDRDEIKRAIDDLERGRLADWEGYPKEKFDWETEWLSQYAEA